MRVAIVASTVCLSIVSLSVAQDASATMRRPTNIPAQGLGPALQAFAQSRDLQVLYFSGVAKDLRTGGASGELTTDEALIQLLSGTGLTYQYVDDKAITVLPIASGTGGSPREHGASSKATSGAAKKKSKSFWSRLRLAQLSSAAQGQGEGEGVGADDQLNLIKRLDLEEVIVTAQKREERLIDAPQSVSVLSAGDLAKLDAVQFSDFAGAVPGLSFITAGAGYTQISLRGVTSGLDISPTVGIYVDEVPYGSSSAFARGAQTSLDVALFDLDRVEILRGPQGTLYGASSMGGLIKYVTKQPDATQFAVSAQAGVAGARDSGVSYSGNAAINAPLIDQKVAVRASGFYSRDGGYVDNVTLGENDVNRSAVYGGRVDVLAKPVEAFSIRLGAFAQQIARNGIPAADYDLTGTPIEGGLDQRRLFEEPFDQHFRLVSGTIDYDFGPVSLTSISSHQTSQTRYLFDYSAAFLPVVDFLGLPYSAVGFLQKDLSTKKFAQEIRLAATGKRALEWVFGGFYTRETSTNWQEFVLRDLAGQPAPNDLFTVQIPSRYEEYAAFGDLTYHFTSKFDASGGIRYAENRQVFTQNAEGVFGVGSPTRRSKEGVSTYLANARYHFSEQATAYVRYGTGYRPGGPNFVGTDPTTGLLAGSPTFEADELESYEIGFKTERSDRTFGVDVAAYFIDWNNIHIATRRGGFGVIANAEGGASVRGAELTLSVRPIRSFTATGAFAYQDAKLSEADTDLGAADGERLPNVPRFTAALNADYELSVDTLQPTVGATVRYVSDRTASFDRSQSFPQYQLPEYATVDLRAGLALGSANLQLYVHNLFDKRGQLLAPTGASAFTGPMQITILQPRTVGVTITTRF